MTMNEETLQLGDPGEVESKPTQHELKETEWTAAVKACDFAKFAWIDYCEDDCRKRNAYHRHLHRDRAQVARANNMTKVMRR